MLLVHNREAFADDLETDISETSVRSESTVLANSNELSHDIQDDADTSSTKVLHEKLQKSDVEKSEDMATATTKLGKTRHSCFDYQEKFDQLIQLAANDEIRIILQRAATRIPQDFSSEKITVNENCDECKRSYRDPELNELYMYLHALSYKVFLCNF